MINIQQKLLNRTRNLKTVLHHRDRRRTWYSQVHFKRLSAPVSKNYETGKGETL